MVLRCCAGGEGPNLREGRPERYALHSLSPYYIFYLNHVRRLSMKEARGGEKNVPSELITRTAYRPMTLRVLLRVRRASGLDISPGEPRANRCAEILTRGERVECCFRFIFCIFSFAIVDGTRSSSCLIETSVTRALNHTKGAEESKRRLLAENRRRRSSRHLAREANFHVGEIVTRS